MDTLLPRTPLAHTPLYHSLLELCGRQIAADDGFGV